MTVCAKPNFDPELNDVPVPIARNFGAGADWSTGLEVNSSKHTTTAWFVRFGGGDWDWGGGGMSTTKEEGVTGGLSPLTGVKWGINYIAFEHLQFARWEVSACGFFGLFCQRTEQIRPHEFTGQVTRASSTAPHYPYDSAGEPGTANSNCTRRYDFKFAKAVGIDETLVGTIDLPGHGQEELPVSVRWTGETGTQKDMIRWWQPIAQADRQHTYQFLFVPDGLHPSHVLSQGGEAVCPEDAPQLTYTDSSDLDLSNTGAYRPAVILTCPTPRPGVQPC